MSSRPARSNSSAWAILISAMGGGSSEFLFAKIPAPLEPRRVAQAELMDGNLGNRLNGLRGGIGDDQTIEIGLVDGLFLDQPRGEKVEQRLPEIPRHQHQRKTADLGGLDQGRGFENFIERAESAGQRDKSVGIFDQ